MAAPLINTLIDFVEFSPINMFAEPYRTLLVNASNQLMVFVSKFYLRKYAFFNLDL